MKKAQSLIQPVDLENIHRVVKEKSIGICPTVHKSPLSNDLSELKARVRQYIEHLKEWNLRYDFELWEKAEAHLRQIWNGLRNTIYLAIECGLYDDVTSVFLEIRHLLQSTGFVKDRIYIAAWLKMEADSRGDWAITCLATYSLAWSYTSCGYYQDLDKAEALWTELAPFLSKMGDPDESSEYRSELNMRLGTYPYDELLVSAYETGARIAVRKNKLDEAHIYIEKGCKEISMLSQQGFLSARLKERFDMAFCYHEGVAYYLAGKLDEAQKRFDETVNRGHKISWNRIVQGAKSWLATIAMLRKEYETCEELLSGTTGSSLPFPSKREGICYLLKAELSSAKGQKHESLLFEENAAKVLKRFSDENNSHKGQERRKSDAIRPILVPF